MDTVIRLIIFLVIGLPIFVFAASIFHLAGGAASSKARKGLWIAALTTFVWVVAAGTMLLPAAIGADAGIFLLPIAGSTVAVGPIAYAWVRPLVLGWRKDVLALVIAAIPTALIYDMFIGDLL